MVHRSQSAAGTDHPSHDSSGPLGLFAISLDRAPERWQALRQAFGNLPWPLTRVPAVDAATDGEAILARRGLNLEHPPQGVGWNPLRFRMFSLVEEAVFVSHLRALEAFLDSAYDYGLILEDDADPVRDLAADLAAILDADVDFEIIKLEGLRRPGTRLVVPEARAASAAVVRSPAPSSGAAAYLVTREAARKLLDNAGAELLRYDDYLSNPVFCGCRCLHLAPYAIRQSDAESTMDPLRKPVRDIRRRGLRFRVLQIWRRAKLRLRLWYDALSRPRPTPLRLVKMPWYEDGAAHSMAARLGK